MREGAIALAALPQADGSVKNRPVVLLREMPPFGDWLVCGISTQLHQRVADFDWLLERSDPDFLASGLKAASIIRLGKAKREIRISERGTVGMAPALRSSDSLQCNAS